MDFLIAITIFTLSLLFSVLKSIPTIIPLLVGLICFIATALHRGFKLNQIFKMMSTGTIKSLIVISILLLIGLITGIWRACGTIPFFVYYGTKLIIPQYFILFAFLLSCIVSFTLGTSFGTGILTISDKGSKGEREDGTGPAIKKALNEKEYAVEY